MCFWITETKNRKSTGENYRFYISDVQGMKAGEWWGGTGGGVPRHVSEPLLLCICCYPIIVSTSHIAHRYSIYFSVDNLVGQLTCCHPICFEGFQAWWRATRYFVRDHLCDMGILLSLKDLNHVNIENNNKQLQKQQAWEFTRARAPDYWRGRAGWIYITWAR